MVAGCVAERQSLRRHGSRGGAGIPEGYEFQSDFALKDIAAGEAKAVLTVLEARGLSPTAEERARILTCADVALLDHWLRQAVTVTEVARLFA